MLTLTAAAVSINSGLAPAFVLNVHYARGLASACALHHSLKPVASLVWLSAGHVACCEGRIHALVALVVCRTVIDCPVRRER